MMMVVVLPFYVAHFNIFQQMSPLQICLIYDLEVHSCQVHSCHLHPTAARVAECIFKSGNLAGSMQETESIVER